MNPELTLTARIEQLVEQLDTINYAIHSMHLNCNFINQDSKDARSLVEGRIAVEHKIWALKAYWS